jgi:hypothetical protein
VAALLSRAQFALHLINDGRLRGSEAVKVKAVGHGVSRTAQKMPKQSRLIYTC